MCRTPISITPSDSRIRKRSDSRIFFWASSEHIIWSSSKISLIWAEWFSSRDLCQTPLVREPIKPAEFGSRFSSGGNQFSKEGSSKSYISNYPYRWLSLADCWRLYFDDGSCLLIKTSVFNDILLVVIKCCRFSSEGVKWRFLFFFMLETYSIRRNCFFALSYLLCCWSLAKVCFLSGSTARQIKVAQG